MKKQPNQSLFNLFSKDVYFHGNAIHTNGQNALLKKIDWKKYHNE